MNKTVIEVQVRAVLPTSGGCAVFIGNTDKVFIVYVDQTVRVDMILDVGEVATRVEVAANAPVVQTDASSVGNVVNGGQIKSMPLNGRNNLWGLLAMAPGVQAAGLNPLIAGNGGFGASNLTIDGVSGNDAGNERNLQTVPTLEAIGEFKVIATPDNTKPIVSHHTVES